VEFEAEDLSGFTLQFDRLAQAKAIVGAEIVFLHLAVGLHALLNP